MVPHYIRGMHQFITWMILLYYEVIGFSRTPIETFDLIFFPYGRNLILERFTASFVIKLTSPDSQIYRSVSLHYGSKFSIRTSNPRYESA